MKQKFVNGLIVLALVLAVFLPTTAQAAYAYDVDFTTFITYQNVGSAATTTLSIMVYDSPTDTSPQTITQPNLAKDASTSVSVGSLVSGNLTGTAVMAADQPLAATLVQLPPSVSVEPYARNRPMSNGFSAGSQNAMIASIVKRYGALQQITKFAVQNAGTSATAVTIKFYGTSSTPVYTSNPITIQSGAGLHVDVGGTLPAGTGSIPNGFIGSAVIETTGGSIVASAMEMDATGFGSKAYEAVGAGSNTVYMPSALCNFSSGGALQTSYFAIQNTGASTVDVTVNWSSGATYTAQNVAPFTKAVVSGCNGNSDGFIGSATIVSTQPVVVLAKVNGGGLSTAYMGFASGAPKVAVPYVRWPTNFRFNAGTMQRTNLAIQNVGGAISGNITVKYVNPDGSIAGTHTITGGLAAGEKVNSNPTNAGLTEFGCYNSCTIFGGGAIVEGPAGSQLAVIARQINYVPATQQRVGEDFSGIPYP